MEPRRKAHLAYIYG